jgi:predicted DNA-binding protein YlxM (UPF0122 family)
MSNQNFPDVEAEDEPSLYVVDSENYQKTKKLEAIYRAKQEVMKVRRNRHDLIDKLGDRYSEQGIEVYKHKLAQAVAEYGSELLPIVEDIAEVGGIEEEDVMVNCLSAQGKVTIGQFIDLDGKVPDQSGERTTTKSPREDDIMRFYRQLGRIQRKLGLGLDIEEESQPAEI